MDWTILLPLLPGLLAFAWAHLRGPLAPALHAARVDEIERWARWAYNEGKATGVPWDQLFTAATQHLGLNDADVARARLVVNETAAAIARDDAARAQLGAQLEQLGPAAQKVLDAFAPLNPPATLPSRGKFP